MSPALWIAAAVGVAATVEDLARRRISNWIPISALVCGVGYQAVTSGWTGAGTACLGALSGFGVFLVFYLLGGMGGGDVKLMAGFGALLGPGRLLEASLWTAAFGGLIAAGVILFRKCRRPCLAAEARPERAGAEFIPYAPAISLGAVVTLLSKA